jgi:uncharacterized membrane protein
LSALFASIVSATQPFADWYASFPRVQRGTAFLHFAGLLTGGGFAIATDRAIWRVSRARDIDERRRVLGEIDNIHRPVVIGLGIVVLSGALLTLADAEAILGSATFWIKMGLVTLLLANGWWLSRNQRQLVANPDPSNKRWARLLAASAASMTLWLAITLAGVILSSG